LVRGLLAGLASSSDSLRIYRSYLREIWFLPTFRSKFFVLSGLLLSSKTFKYWDCGWNETLGPKGANNELITLTNKLDSLNHLQFKNILFLSFFIVVVFFLFYCCSLYKA
jgi:hypothetical protein